jgi:hypothetical protein
MIFNHDKIILNLILVLLISSCRSEATYKTIIKEYVNDSDSTHKSSSYQDSLYYYKKSYVVGFTYNNASIIRKIDGQLTNRPYGHYFEFDNYGTLESYKFRLDNNRYSYQISYDIDSSRYLETGNPFVDYWKDESKATDSTINILCFFSKFPRREINIFVSINGVDYNKVASQKSKLMPFLEEVELSLPIHQENVFFKIESDNLIYNWKNLIVKRYFTDTLSFK